MSIGIEETSCKAFYVMLYELHEARSQYNLHEVSMAMSAAQCRAARGLVGWSQADLALSAKVGRATIADFEAGKRDPYERTLADLQHALESAGVILVDENGEGPGVRLRKGKKPFGHPEPAGPATDAVKQMDADIERHKASRRKK